MCCEGEYCKALTMPQLLGMRALFNVLFMFCVCHMILNLDELPYFLSLIRKETEP